MNGLSDSLKLARRLIKNRDGVSTIEFAVAAPVIFLMVAGLIEMSLMMFVVTLAEGGLREASRFGITGNVPPGMTREQQILTLIEDSTIGLIDMSTTNISYDVYPSFGDVGKPEPYVDNNPANGSYDVGESYTDVNGNGQWDPDMGAAGLGGPGEIVRYTIEFDWSMLTPLLTPIVGTNGTVRMQSSVAVRNEPYPVAPPVGAP